MPRDPGAYLLLAISALLYAFSLVFENAWYCTFLFFVPFYYAFLYYAITWKHGFVWGFVSYTLLFSFSFFVLKDYAQGSFRFVGFPFLVIYGACSSALWFFMLTKCHTYKYFILIASTILYFWFLDNVFFVVFGVFEGNSLFFPALPLIQIPWLLWSVPWISLYGVLLLVCINSFLLARWFVTWRVYYVLGVFSLASFFSFGCFFQHKQERPSWLSYVGVVQVNNDSKSCNEQVQKMTYAIINLCTKYPDIRCIFAPESQCSYPLNMHNKACAMLYDNSVSSGITVCCGAYRKEEDKLYNSLCVLSPAQPAQWHDKQHLFYFTEYVPSLWSWVPGVSSLFLSSQQSFTQSTVERMPITISCIGSFVPYLCSELLLAPSLNDQYCALPIVCLANDSWFSGDYMPRLMFWQARLKAFMWQRSIVYVAYHYAAWIDRYGNVHELQT